MSSTDQVWELPTLHIGRRVHIYNSLPSTNDFAAELIQGEAVLAREQTAGRGQYGRSWHSPAGTGVWLSVVVDPPANIRRPVMLVAWVSVAVCELVQSVTHKVATIKWPNDALVQGKKVAGILIEERNRTIVGIGMNVNQSASDFAAVGLPDATSLAQLTGRQLDCDEVARGLITTLDLEFDLLLNRGTQDLESRWRERIQLAGQLVRLELHNGQAFAGRLRELTFSAVEILSNDEQSLRLSPEQVRSLAQVL